MYAARAPCVRASTGSGTGLACSSGRLAATARGAAAPAPLASGRDARRSGGWSSAVRLGQQQAPARRRVVRVAAEISTPGVRPGTTQRQQAATLLGLQGDEDKRAIKSAFRRLALRCVAPRRIHPTWTSAQIRPPATPHG